MERYYPIMIDVQGGTFSMGCDTTLNQRCEDDEALHLQEVSDFKMAKYETTWWQYNLFCAATRQEYEAPEWGREGNNPAVNISWFDAVLYIDWLNNQFSRDTVHEISNKTKGDYGDYYDVTLISGTSGFRLPTEAEWEYVAKGGIHQSSYIYAGGNDIDLSLIHI